MKRWKATLLEPIPAIPGVWAEGFEGHLRENRRASIGELVRLWRAQMPMSGTSVQPRTPSGVVWTPRALFQDRYVHRFAGSTSPVKAVFNRLWQE